MTVSSRHGCRQEGGGWSCDPGIALPVFVLGGRAVSLSRALCPFSRILTSTIATVSEHVCSQLRLPSERIGPYHTIRDDSLTWNGSSYWLPQPGLSMWLLCHLFAAVTGFVSWPRSPDMTCNSASLHWRMARPSEVSNGHTHFQP